MGIRPGRTALLPTASGDGLGVDRGRPGPAGVHRADQLPRGAAERAPGGGAAPDQPARRRAVAGRGADRPGHPRPGAGAGTSADGDQPGRHRTAAQGHRGRGPAGLGPGPAAAGALHRLRPPGEQRLPGHQPVQGGADQRARPRHPGRGPVRERHPLGVGGIQEPRH